MPQFHETGYGRKFLEGDFPDMVKQLTKIAAALEVKETKKNIDELYLALYEELDVWYVSLPFIIVHKITGINPLDYPELIKIPEDEEDKGTSREEAIDLARDSWNNCSLQEKIEYHERYKDERHY